MSPVEASAAGETVTLTPAQTRALFGDELAYTYFNGTDYVDGVATYLTSAVEYVGGNIDHFGDVPLTGRYIIYQSADMMWNDSGSDYFSVRLSPVVSLSGLTDFQMSVGCTIASKYTDGELTEVEWWRTNAYPQNYVSYNLNGDTFQNSCAWYHASPTVISPYISYAEFTMGSGSNASNLCFRLAPIDIHNSVLSTVQDIQFTAQHMVQRTQGTNGPSGRTYFIVKCPTLSTTYQANQGGQTGTDLTATNQKLDNIIAILSMIAQNNNYSGTMTNEELVDAISDQQAENLSENGPLAWLKEKFHNLTDRVGSIVSGFTSSLTNLFSPSESAITAFKDSVDGTLHETFGDMYSDNLHDMLMTHLQTQMTEGSAMDAIAVQPIRVNLAGTDFAFPPAEPGQLVTIPLRPQYDRLHLLYEAFAMLIDAIAVFAVINMLKSKWESILTNREVND